MIFRITFIAVWIILVVSNAWLAKELYYDRKYSTACFGFFVSGLCLGWMLARFPIWMGW